MDDLLCPTVTSFEGLAQVFDQLVEETREMARRMDQRVSGVKEAWGRAEGYDHAAAIIRRATMKSDEALAKLERERAVVHAAKEAQKAAKRVIGVQQTITPPDASEPERGSVSHADVA